MGVCAYILFIYLFFKFKALSYSKSKTLKKTFKKVKGVRYNIVCVYILIIVC